MYMYVYMDTPLWEKKALVGDEKVSLYLRVINLCIYMYMYVHIYPHIRLYIIMHMYTYI
jgi:hypothetical protein